VSEEKPQTIDAQIETALAVVPKDKAAIAIGERGLAFENAAELYRFSEALVKSGVVPKGSTAGAVMAAILKGRALGLDEVTSLTNITVINGRVQMGGALVLALVRKHHACAEGPTYWHEGEGNTRAAFVKARRVDEREAVVHRFGLDDAARAGLTSKDTYRQWTDDMLLWRAVARMGRRQFSDLLAGVYVPGEVLDATPTEPPATATDGPPPGDPLLDELGGPAEDLPVPSAPAPSTAVVEPLAPIAPPPPEAPPTGPPARAGETPGPPDVEAVPGPPADVCTGQATVKAAPAREPGEDDEPAPPFPSHAEADRAIAAAEKQSRLFEAPAIATHVDNGPAPRRRRRLEE